MHTLIELEAESLEAVRVRRHRLATNPWLTRFYKNAVRWHEAKPAAYQGGC